MHCVADKIEGQEVMISSLLAVQACSLHGEQRYHMNVIGGKCIPDLYYHMCLSVTLVSSGLTPNTYNLYY